MSFWRNVFGACQVADKKAKKAIKKTARVAKRMANGEPPPRTVAPARARGGFSINAAIQNRMAPVPKPPPLELETPKPALPAPNFDDEPPVIETTGETIEET